MLQVRGYLDLGEKTLDPHDGAQLRVEHLERDATIVSHIARHVHRRHSAAADLAFDRIAACERSIELRDSVHPARSRLES
jgi:hypothetical protein